MRVWESKREYREERRDDSKSNNDKLNSGSECDLNTSNNLDDNNDSEYEGIVTQDIESTDILKDAQRLVILILH